MALVVVVVVLRRGGGYKGEKLVAVAAPCDLTHWLGYWVTDS